MTPIRLGRATIAIVGVALIVLWAGRCEGHRAAIAESTVRHERTNGFVLARHATAMRLLAESLVTATDRRETALRTSRAKLSARLVSTQGALTHAHSVLADTLTDIADVRKALGVQVQVTVGLVADVQRYADTVDALVTGHAAERLAFQRALVATDPLIASKDRLLAAIQKQGQCRIAFVPCPSRTTSALVASVATLVVIVAVR